MVLGPLRMMHVWLGIIRFSIEGYNMITDIKDVQTNDIQSISLSQIIVNEGN